MWRHRFSSAMQLALAGAVCLRTIAALFERSLDTARYACSVRAPRRLFRFDARRPPTASGMTAAARVTGADTSSIRSRCLLSCIKKGVHDWMSGVDTSKFWKTSPRADKPRRHPDLLITLLRLFLRAPYSFSASTPYES